MNGRERQDRNRLAAPRTVGGRAAASLAAAAFFSLGGLGSGCDHFRVESFHGSKILMTLSGVKPTAPGHHIELWAREGADDNPATQNIVRLLHSDAGKEANGADCALGDTCLPSAYAIVYALGEFTVVMEADPNGSDLKRHAHPNDPCMIDGEGNLVWGPDAIDPATRKAQGVLGAAAIQRRIDEVTIGAPSLMAFVPWDDAELTPPPDLGEAKTKEDRNRVCRKELWTQSAASYTGNPRQTTAPIHGALLGVADFMSIAPPQLLGGIGFASNYALVHARELFLTDTPASIAQVTDCLKQGDIKCGGTVILDGTAMNVGAGAIYFELSSPDSGGPFGSMTGSASIEINLDQFPQQF